MHFKLAYCGFTLALVIAACGPKPSEPTPDLGSTAESVQARQMDVAAALGSAAGGANNPTMTAYAAGLDRIAIAMTTVKDEASARAAAQTIAQVNADLKKLGDDMDAMSDQEKAAAAMALAPQLLDVQQKIAMATSSIMAADPALMTTLSDELEKIPSMN